MDDKAKEIIADHPFARLVVARRISLRTAGIFRSSMTDRAIVTLVLVGELTWIKQSNDIVAAMSSHNYGLSW